ncbi:MAG: MoxR-like ATPase [Verrucomicrobiales bacterium]|jgi:MoxR-like ATPase
MPEQHDLGGREVEIIEELHQHYATLRQEMAQVIVGLDDVIEQLMMALICRGHCILEGVPGLAKTKLISTLASVLQLSFKRIQFTPDLMPADITGTDVLEEDHTTGKRIFRFIPGPLFGNMILADEINRTPPKTQSALLEAMEEHQLTVAGNTYKLPDPFLVLATQNPIEQEGTYPLPEAQLDRFMFKVLLGYPTAEEEMEIARRVTRAQPVTIKPILDATRTVQFQQVVRGVVVGDQAYEFAADLVRRSRPKEKEATEYVIDNIAWGAGPRATIYLIMAAKARAVLEGRHHVTTQDIAASALPVLRHRIMPTFNAEASGLTSDDIVRNLLSGSGKPATAPPAIPR